MADFIETTLGWLNLDHVLLIRYPDPRLKEAPEQFVQLRDGRSMTLTIIGDPAPLPTQKKLVVEPPP